MNKLAVILLLTTAFGAFGQNVEQIIRNMDENNTFDTFKGTGKVVIEGKYGKRVSEYEAFAKGSDDTLIEFISGEEEGQKIFKTPDDLYIKYPYAEEIQRLSRKKTIGAVSYDEISGEKDTLKNYAATLLGQEVLDGVEVYKVELIAKTSKVAHYKQEVFIHTTNYSVLKTLYYSKSGKLTKEMIATKFDTIGGKVIAVHSLVTDKLKKNNSTENIITTMEINIPIEDSIFSLDQLSW